MRCPLCIDDGEISRVFYRGGSRTLMATKNGVYFDSGGRFHNHDANEVKASFECDHKHRFEVHGPTWRCCYTQPKLIVYRDGVADEITRDSWVFDRVFNDGDPWQSIFQ